jgi:hypothetical protein
MTAEANASKPLTYPQLSMLLRIVDGKRGASGLVEFFCATGGEFATVRALHRRGLVEWRYIASRLFGAQLTALGKGTLHAMKGQGDVQ